MVTAEFHTTKSVDKSHIQFFDYIRGVAALWVFACHCLGYSFWHCELNWKGWFRDFDTGRVYLGLLPITFGWVAIPIFFVISGFCIHLSYQRTKYKSWIDYALRRFFRIYPAYVIALLIYAFLNPLHPLHWNSRGDLANVAAHFLLIHNLFESPIFHGFNPSFWSIAVEFQLYLLYPFVLVFARKLGWKKTLWITGIVEIGMRATAAIWCLNHEAGLPRWFTGSPFIFWFSWSIGAAIAESFLTGKKLPFKGKQVFLWPALMIATYFFKPSYPFSVLFASLSAASVIVACLQRYQERPSLPHFLRGGRVWKYFSALGIISYSFYLIHQPVIEIAGVVLKKLSPSGDVHPVLLYVMFLPLLLPIIVVARWLYRFAELPGIELGKWAIKQRRIRVPEVRGWFRGAPAESVMVEGVNQRPYQADTNRASNAASSTALHGPMGAIRLGIGAPASQAKLSETVAPLSE
jgi:peptidoglycan/LPS O-acetylase OafA/YrhL